ncbi:MAG: AzlC family ABC transporter permease [Treponema sp.]|nr:AzlC family ABC transporter permease [Treponema sp.]
MTKRCFSLALKTTIPVFLGYIACGIAFGLVLVNAGYPWWLSPLMSIVIFAGAAQFAAIPLFVAGTPLYIILLTELLLNIRHIVYGLPLISQFKKCGKRTPYLIFALSDETFSLLTTTEVPEDVSMPDFFATIAVLDQIYWVAGSTIGAVAGMLIPFDMTGVDFSLTALFAVLTVDQTMKFFKKDKISEQSL